MPQHKMILDNQPGAAFRADLNKALAALVSNSYGNSEPTTKYPFQFWVNSESGLLQMRYADNTNWMPLMQINSPLLANYGPVAPGALQPFQLWADTNSGYLKMRNQANTAWVEIGLLGAKNLGIAQVETGMLVFSASGIVEPGFIKANGAAVSRTTYAALFAKIGTRYGAGDGSTTFNLPDARGEFFRGWDDGRGVDSGRALGSWQDQELKSHTHNLLAAWAPYNITYAAGPNYSGWWGGGTSTTTATGGAETRPRNIAQLVLIKY